MKRRNKKIKRRLILLLLCTLFATSCSKRETQSDKTLFGDEKTEKEQITIRRFEQALFAPSKQTTEQHLLSIEKNFKPMFAASLGDKQYMAVVKAFVEDTEMKKVYNVVKQYYPDMKFLEDALAEALPKIRKIRQDTCKTDIYTLIVGPAEYSFAYQNRILVYPEFSTISIDAYCMDALSEHPYYKSMPKYLQTTLTKDNIAPDYIRTYLQEITFKDIPLQNQNPDATLLDCIIDDGKYSYAVAALLPKTPLHNILRYTEEQQKWVENNEYNIWSYIIQNRLLYNKDRTKYLSLIAEGPTTKGITGSPSRIGNYIGYRIVQAYMGKNPITLDSLFRTTNSELILKASEYKPQKR